MFFSVSLGAMLMLVPLSVGSKGVEDSEQASGCAAAAGAAATVAAATATASAAGSCCNSAGVLFLDTAVAVPL